MTTKKKALLYWLQLRSVKKYSSEKKSESNELVTKIYF